MNLKTIFKEAWEKTFVSSEVRKRNLEDFIDNLPDIEIGEDKKESQMQKESDKFWGKEDKPKENVVDKHINYGFNLLNKYRKAVEAKPKNICNHFKWSLAPSGKGVTCDGCGLYCGLTMEIEDKPKDWEVEFDKMLGKNYIHTQVTKAFIQELLDEKDRETAKYQRREDEHCRMLEEMEVKDSLFIDGVLYQRVATDID